VTRLIVEHPKENLKSELTNEHPKENIESELTNLFDFVHQIASKCYSLKILLVS